MAAQGNFIAWRNGFEHSLRLDAGQSGNLPVALLLWTDKQGDGSYIVACEVPLVAAAHVVSDVAASRRPAVARWQLIMTPEAFKYTQRVLMRAMALWQADLLIELSNYAYRD